MLMPVFRVDALNILVNDRFERLHNDVGFMAAAANLVGEALVLRQRLTGDARKHLFGLQRRSTRNTAGCRLVHLELQIRREPQKRHDAGRKLREVYPLGVLFVAACTHLVRRCLFIAQPADPFEHPASLPPTSHDTGMPTLQRRALE